MKDYIADLGIAAQLEQTSSRGQKLFERLGGRPTLDRVHKIFYESVEHRMNQAKCLSLDYLYYWPVKFS